MTLKQFIDKYNGVPNVGNTDTNKGECVGLVMVYIKEVLGLSHVWGHAKDIFYNAPEEEWEKVENAPNVYPNAGDIMCWGGSWGGGYGHIGVVESSSPATDSFKSFEQNYPTGSPPHIINRTAWSGIIGWLSPKGIGGDCEERLQIMTQNRNDWMNKANAFERTIEEEREKHGEEVKSKNILIDQYEKQASTFDSKVLEMQKRIDRAEKERDDFRGAYTKLEGKFKAKEGEWEVEKIAFENKLTDSRVRIEQLSKPIREMSWLVLILTKLGVKK